MHDQESVRKWLETLHQLNQQMIEQIPTLEIDDLTPIETYIAMRERVFASLQRDAEAVRTEEPDHQWEEETSNWATRILEQDQEVTACLSFWRDEIGNENVKIGQSKRSRNVYEGARTADSMFYDLKQ